jgi:hypothetical protein
MIHDGRGRAVCVCVCMCADEGEAIRTPIVVEHSLVVDDDRGHRR